MPRIVSVYLPRWPIIRFLRAQSRKEAARERIDPDLPFVLIVEGASGGLRLAAVNEAAERFALVIGDTLADARAKAGFLQVHAVEPEADDDALARLVLWATRYTPTVAPFDEESGADGLFLEIEGSSHLFGGEENLVADLSRRLGRIGIPARIAVADTAGTAWALSRFHRSRRVVLPSGEEAKAIAPLPVSGLRIPADMRETLRRLGFKRIGSLEGKPRAPFAARFERMLLERLDQALGRAREPLQWIAPPPAYHTVKNLLEPIFTHDAVIAVATRMMEDLVPPLTADGVGARLLRLTLCRVDGDATSIEVGFTLPTRDPSHVARLLALKLERMESDLDAGFGYETLSLAVPLAETMEESQADHLASAGVLRREPFAALVDGLRQKLGADRVRRLAPVESHLPERSESPLGLAEEASAWPSPDRSLLRPPLLLPTAEPADVTALVPEGPPRRFRWRGATHGVAAAQGPERIAAEWWRHREARPTRDYYLVEDETGRRYWLFREGLYDRETAAPRWFVHGFFG